MPSISHLIKSFPKRGASANLPLIDSQPASAIFLAAPAILPGLNAIQSPSHFIPFFPTSPKPT